MGIQKPGSPKSTMMWSCYRGCGIAQVLWGKLTFSFQCQGQHDHRATWIVHLPCWVHNAMHLLDCKRHMGGTASTFLTVRFPFSGHGLVGRTKRGSHVIGARTAQWELGPQIPGEDSAMAEQLAQGIQQKVEPPTTLLPPSFPFPILHPSS